MDFEGKLVKLAALEAAFDYFTNKHWIPLQAIVLSLHVSGVQPGTHWPLEV